jgi:hypothetical protein
MLSEIYMLRLEAILRASIAAAPVSKDARFVPITAGGPDTRQMSNGAASEPGR